MEGRYGSWREAVKAIASFNCCDGALEVRAIQELSELEQAMTQHEELQEERARKWRMVRHTGYDYSECTNDNHQAC